MEQKTKAAKRILILTASIGSGHTKAAEAIATELRRALPGAEITTVDFMARRISFLHALMKKAYLVMLDFVPNLYDVFYKLSGGKAGGKATQGAFARVMAPAMRRLMRRYAPNLVLCTHPFPEGAAALVKREDPSFTLATVMTDYSLHSIWLCPHVDHYFMATEAMREEMRARGFAEASLHVTGIPVAQALAVVPDYASVRHAMAIEQGQRAILLMGGGLGLGGIEETVEALESIPERLALLVVAGRNEALKERVQDFADRSHHQVFVWGYTDRVPVLMRAADLLITKPGALTMSEAFVLGLPMLLHDPIPGPETENAVYATRHRAAIWLHPGEDLAAAVRSLLAGGSLPAMANAAQRCGRAGAASAIVRTLFPHE
ncbi:MAG: glycosyltransferase [Mitsuokella sp.]